MASKKNNNKTKSSTTKKVTATQKYKKKITSFEKMLPNYKPTKIKDSYTPTEFTGQYTPEEYVSDYTPTQFTEQYNPGTYNSKYLPQIEEAINKISNWSYDPLQDASYQALAKVYGARGNLAAKSSLADAAALNGGYGTSYATSAAQQARNQYNQELASYIPQLEQAAFDRLQGGYNALMDLDNSLYGRFSDDESRRLQSLQFGLDTAGFNEGNRQFAANHGLDVFNTNEANRYNAANYALDAFKTNEANRQFDATYGLDVAAQNEANKQFAANFGLSKVTTGADLVNSYLGYKAATTKPKATGSGGGRGGSRSSGGGGGGYSGGGSGSGGGGNGGDPYRSVIMGSGKNGQNVRSAKGLTTIKEKNKRSGGRVIL